MGFVDLLPAMHAQAKDSSEYLLPCDGHWNAHGHAVAAQLLREALPQLYQASGRQDVQTRSSRLTAPR